MPTSPRSSAAYQRFWSWFRAVCAAAQARCALCRQAIDYQLRYPHPRSWSLDHRIALHAGGSLLDPANAQAAHLRCNQRRGAIEGNRRRRLRRQARTGGGSKVQGPEAFPTPHSFGPLPGGSTSHEDPPPPPGW